MIVLDTSGLVAVMDRGDRWHKPAVEALECDPGPYVIPALIMAEIAWLIESRFGQHVLLAFLDDVRHEQYSLDFGDEDVSRIHALLKRYADMPLGFSDAAVIACAERHGKRILTLDRRHFGVVAGAASLELLPSQADAGEPLPPDL